MGAPQSGLIDVQDQSSNTRIGDENGTHPDDLPAAARAGWFSMALSRVLGRAGFVAERIDTCDDVTVEPRGRGG